MYAIKGILDGKTFMLSEPYSDDQVVTPVLKEIVGKSGTLEFDINLLHPNYEDVVMYKTYISVERDGEAKTFTILKPLFVRVNLDF